MKKIIAYPLCSFSSSWTPEAAQNMRNLVSDQFDLELIITGNSSVRPGGIVESVVFIRIKYFTKSLGRYLRRR